MADFEKVKEYLYQLGYNITSEDKENEIVIINDTRKGISNLIIDCESPIIIFEQFIANIKSDNSETYKTLLKLNRNLIHGAFVLDEDGKKVLFRDTLRLENLDLNELKGSIDALSIAMFEYTDILLEMFK